MHFQVSEKLVAVVEQPHAVASASNTSQLDPSSEAESLSHVASGIAASLGLPADSPSNVNLPETTSGAEMTSGPLSDLHFEEEEFVRENRGVKRSRESTENDTCAETPIETSEPPKKVTKLALEWTEEESKS